jgi:hypothetical protein
MDVACSTHLRDEKFCLQLWSKDHGTIILNLMLEKLLITVWRGRATAHTVSHRPLALEARVCTQINACGVCDGQSGIVTGFS